MEVGSDAPVVMLVFDEFPSISMLDGRGRLDAERYPNLARLAGHSTWFPNATTVADFTGRAVPSILTGGDPGPDVLPTASALPENVFTLLGGTYGLDVHEDTTRLCPAELCAEDTTESFPERMESLVSDLSVVLRPRAAPRRLPRRHPARGPDLRRLRGRGPRRAEPARGGS